jgi:beta-lactamase regulating signal transducer with metallopeptidase domain
MLSEISPAYLLLLTLVWQSSLFITAGLIGSFLLKRHPARAHQVLLLSMVAAITVTALSTIVKRMELGLFPTEPVIQNSTSEDVAPSGNLSQLKIDFPEVDDLQVAVPEPLHDIENSTVVAAANEYLKFPLSQVLLYGWIAVSTILIIRLLVTFILGARLVRQAQPLNNLKINQNMVIIASKLRIKNTPFIFGSDRITSPVIWCWRHRPILLIPNKISLSSDKIDWGGVFCHELAHLKRRDHICGLLCELITALLPWHLLFWSARLRLINLSELACDDWVIAGGSSGTNYAELLLDLTPAGQMAFVPAIVRSKNALAGRIVRILKDSCGNPRPGTKWMLSAVIITICLAMLIAFAQCRPAGHEQQNISMTSDESEIFIRQAIKRKINKNPDELTDDDYKKVEDLTISANSALTHITDLSLLKNLTNLKSLTLMHIELSDISILAYLPKLQSLNISYSKTSDISALAGLTQLEELNLNGTAVSDIRALAKLTNLKKLTLNGTAVSDISPLANLTNLETLELGSTNISDIRVLTRLTKLRTLSLKDCKNIVDIGPLANLTILKSLDLSYMPIGDINALAKLKMLRMLNLCGTNVADISLLAQFSKLSELHIDPFRFSNEQIENLRNALPNLNISANVIDNKYRR